MNPNNVKCVVASKIDVKQKTLGMIVTTTDECRFYFVDSNVGKSITSSGTKYMDHVRQYLFDFYEGSIKLKDILVSAGAELVENKEEADIDLSIEALEKDTIIKLIGRS